MWIVCINLSWQKGVKAITMKEKSSFNLEEEEEIANYLFNEVKEKEVLPVATVKNSQFKIPKFEFSGACEGCGETVYLKLLTQLFGDRLIIANATGCSSIYSASAPNMAYHVAWENSLFEDNAEFGYDMKIADIAMKNRITTLIKDNISLVKKSEVKIYKDYVKEQTLENADKLLEIVDDTKIAELLELKDFIRPRSFFLVGGDGWAYDIGYNGIDHVLANHENVNILVLDTEVYSNTGGQSSKSTSGQSSKSTRKGEVAKFASNGKQAEKKDLLKIALTYPHVYVASMSLGANPNQSVKVLQEVESYDGPSIIAFYAPCIAQ